MRDMPPAAAERMRERTKEYKRLGRLLAKPGFKAVKLDDHVKAWRAKEKAEKASRNFERFCVSRLSEEERIQRRRDIDNQKTAKLKDKYVRHLIVKSMPSLRGARIPQSLIDLERMRLMVVREIASRRKQDEELQ